MGFVAESIDFHLFGYISLLQIVPISTISRSKRTPNWFTGTRYNIQVPCVSAKSKSLDLTRYISNRIGNNVGWLSTYEFI